MRHSNFRWAGPTSVSVAFVAGCVSLSLALAAPSVQGAETSGGLDRLAEYYETNPGLKTTRSSGWKPFNRELWLQSDRVSPPGTDAAWERFQAFETALERIEAHRGEDRLQRWFSIGPIEYSGRTPSIDFHPENPEIVYVGTAGGGLWRSQNGGDSWDSLTDNLPTLAIGAVCIPTWDPDVILIGTGEGSGVGFVAAGKGMFGNGLLRSVDGGETWETTSLSYNVGAQHGFNVIEDSPETQTLLAGANDGLWRSTDDGETWTEVMSNGNFFDVKWKPNSSNIVYVSKGKDPFSNDQNDNGIFVSTDDGQTFTLAGTGQPPGPTIAKTKIAVTPANPDYIYAHYIRDSNSGTLGIFRSTDGGATWEARNTNINMAGGQGFYNNIITVDPGQPDRVIAGGNVLYVSDDGGENFEALNSDVPFGDGIAPHWDNHAIAYEPGSNDNVWIATDGGPWRSTDDGDTWTRRTYGLVSYQFYDIAVAQTDPIFTMGGTQDNGMPGRVDDESWFHSTFVADGFVHNIDPADHAIVYSEWQGGRHIKSTDGGYSWNPIQDGITGSGAWLTPVEQDQTNGDRLFTSTLNRLYRTTNGGEHWDPIADREARWISVHPTNGDIVWTVSNTTGIGLSTDGGDSWEMKRPSNGREIKIQADPSQLGSAFVVCGGYNTSSGHIFHTSDFGQTWFDVTGDFPNIPANTFVVDPAYPDDWYVGADVGVWRSQDGGQTWLPFGEDLANALITDLEIRHENRKLVAGTYGRGVWELNLNPADPADVPSVEATFPNLMLDPPHPNPVRSETLLRFAAKTDLEMSLEIVDVQGRRVQMLATGLHGDGLVRIIPWSPESLTDGVYFAILRSGDQQISRKILVQR